MLIMASVFVMGSYFSYDNPAAIEKTLEKDLNLTQTQYSLLYSTYAYPNIILPLAGGFLLDHIGFKYLYS